MNRNYYAAAFLLLLQLWSATTLKAQHSVDIGVATGFTNYFGDLGNDEFYQAS